MTPESYGAYMKSLDEASRRAREEFAAIYLNLDYSKPVECKEVLLVAVPVIVEKYSKIAALIAARFYEQERATVVGGAYRAVLAKPVDREVIEAKVRYALSFLFGDGDVSDGEKEEKSK